MSDNNNGLAIGLCNIAQQTTAIDPEVMGITMLGNAIGLSPDTMNIVKIGAGFVLSNPDLIINGAAGFAASHLNDAPAHTEVPPPAAQPDGYSASSSGVNATGDCGPSYGDSELFTLDSSKLRDWDTGNPGLESARRKIQNDEESGLMPKSAIDQEWRTYADSVKRELAADPDMRASFEAQFNVKIESANYGSGDQILVRPELPTTTSHLSGSTSLENDFYEVKKTSSSRKSSSSSRSGGDFESEVEGKVESAMAGAQKDVDDASKLDLSKPENAMKLQKAMQAYERMYEMLSAIEKMFNDMSMAAIRNMAG